ncbi:MFS general substrate transporter [Gigaspora margarita]|uniref:Lysosomal dipeptide transporter MFSD1 n=1 Tax=Gigaspora margarita TaxID=4874 RepID=A0A8H4A2G8_GIGMA|nr:MFS general substrate transporter [Gigaspora margarita]
MSSNPFNASENNRPFSTNERECTALPVCSVNLDDRPENDENNENNSLSNDDDNKINIIEEELNRPWKYKVFALVCALSLSGTYVQHPTFEDNNKSNIVYFNDLSNAVGSHFAAHTLGALKSIVKDELGITNSQYGIIQSSASLVNTILPILGGVFIDTFGTTTGSILATSLIAAGNILVALSTNLRSFPMMVSGRILYGIGSGTIITIQTTILSHWFKGKGLSIALGIQIATARLASFLANLTVVPIKRVAGFYGWAFWFAALLCMVSLVINIVYIYVMKIINENLSEQEIKKLKQKKTFNPRILLCLPTIYWIFVLLEFEFGSSWTSFLHINTELIKTRWHLSNEEAANRSSFAQFLPIFITPFLGYFLDRFGRRSITLISSAVFLTASIYLLGFTFLTPVIGMLLFSISLSLGPVTTLSSIPIILPLDYVGTGLGIVKSCSNIGSTLFDIIGGILQDLDGGSYSRVMQLYLVTSIIAILVSIWLSIVARTWYDGIIDMKEDKRREYYEEIRTKDDEQGQERRNYDGQDANTRFINPSKRNWIYITTFVIVLILSWALYFIFSNFVV